MADDVRVKTTELLLLAREYVANPGVDTADSLIRRLVDRLETILANDPPDGWFPMGSHVGFDGPLEFSDETDEAGCPKWERHAVTA